ncbi:MAG TPA: hypothetical protein DIT13_11040 [Verrucomicrobiales bacterium]|nr:hypothetical protein [Verrucomicrobiales bacterium]
MEIHPEEEPDSLPGFHFCLDSQNTIQQKLVIKGRVFHRVPHHVIYCRFAKSALQAATQHPCHQNNNNPYPPFPLEPKAKANGSHQRQTSKAAHENPACSENFGFRQNNLACGSGWHCDMQSALIHTPNEFFMIK